MIFSGNDRETSMSSEDVIKEIRESLNGRPGQPIVFGVCKALADRFGTEPWTFRLAAIVLTLFWALPALTAYIIAGLVMKETEVRRSFPAWPWSSAKTWSAARPGCATAARRIRGAATTAKREPLGPNSFESGSTPPRRGRGHRFKTRSSHPWALVNPLPADYGHEPMPPAPPWRDQSFRINFVLGLWAREFQDGRQIEGIIQFAPRVRAPQHRNP